LTVRFALVTIAPVSDTPLTDFLATLAEPTALARFRADPDGVIAAAGLPDDLAALVRDGHPGAIRVRAVKELEAAGLAPLVSDKFGPGGGEEVQQPMNIQMNSYTTSTYTSTTYQSTTFTTNTTDFITTTSSSTTTTTNDGGLGGFGGIDWLVDELAKVKAYYESPAPADGGELVIVGAGIRAISDLTLDAEAQVRSAQKVLYCVADPVMERRLHLLNPTSESLYGLYGNGKPREETYQQMVDAMLAPVHAGLRVCGVFYGHPGVFAWPTHQAIRVARHHGFRAEMHAGVSADACLFADLGIDPSRPGCHSLEATSLLIHRRRPDTASHVLIWQAECVGDAGFDFSGYERHNFPVLIEELHRHYPQDHPVVIYEAASLPQMRPTIVQERLDTIRKEQLTGISTLYLPPVSAGEIDEDMCRRLGMPVDDR
jgi:precorrin-4 methylase